MNRPEDVAKFEERLRLLRLLWAAMLLPIPMYAVVGIVSRPDVFTRRWYEFMPPGASGTDIALSGVLYVVGLLAAIAAGPLVFRRFVARAERERRPDLVQTGMIIALSLCETGAIFGLVNLFLTGSLNSFTLMAMSVLGMIVVFPRREYLAAATYGKQ